MNDDILYGKDKTEGIVAIEYKDGELVIFTEDSTGVKEEKVKYLPYSLYESAPKGSGTLKGDLPLKYFKKYEKEKDQENDYFAARRKGYEVWRPNNVVEGAMIKNGYTFFKGRTPKDISILSFDIETTTIDPKHKDAKILSVACTYRKGSIQENKLFAYDDYPSEQSMIRDFADYVRKQDPSILTGFNILGFDIPYIVKRHPDLKIARNMSRVVIEQRTREKRKDASQSYSFNAAHVYGRQIIDAFHFTIDYDLANGRKLPSYRLKEVMKFMGLEKEGRQHYDASKIKDLYHIPEEWEKIKAYNIDDGEDVIKLLDKIWEPYFYFTQFIPMTFERISQTATGTKVNNLMLRAYLQQRHSVPVGDNKESYPGGMVIGNPGVFHHVNKVDVASLYPSIMILKKLCVNRKDPFKYFPYVVETFTASRLADKAKYAETGDKYYDSQQAAKKIFINSLYGFLGAGRLNFNSMKAADAVTAKGREITQKGIDWSENKGWRTVNADTDSFSYTTGVRVPPDEFKAQIADLNALYPKEIIWEDDGQYESVLVLKAKNYVLKGYDGTKVVKGNSIKATMKEPALREFIQRVIDKLLDGCDEYDILRLYFEYVLYITCIHSIDSIGPWCSKLTVTKTVLEKKATRQARIREALEGSNYSESDKIWIFFESPEKVTLKENFNGTYCQNALFKKLHDTAKIFSPVLDVSILPNFKLKRSKQLLELAKKDPEKALEKVRRDASLANKGSNSNAQGDGKTKKGE